MEDKQTYTYFMKIETTKEGKPQSWLCLDPDIEWSVLDPTAIRFKMSDSEKALKKQQYRKNYRSRPEVIAKMEAKNKDPEVIEARKLYAEDPETKKRKKEYALARRKIIQELKAAEKEKYDELKKKIMPPPKPRKKRSLSESEPSSKEESATKKRKLDSSSSVSFAIREAPRNRQTIIEKKIK